MTGFSVFMPLQGIAPGTSWIGGGVFEGLQKHMEHENEGNENKITLEDFNCTMYKMDRDGENKTQRLYWCCSSYVLSKLIVDNGLENLWRRENQDCLKFTRYERSFCKNPGQTGSILIYKLLTIPRLITQWYPLLIIITLFLFFYGQTPLTNSEFSSATKISCFLLKTEKTTTLGVSGGEAPNTVLKKMVENFLKVPPLKKILEFQYQKKSYEICTKTNFRNKNQTND